MTIYRPEHGSTPADRMRAEMLEHELAELGRAAATGGLRIHPIAADAIGTPSADQPAGADAAYLLVDEDGEVLGPARSLDRLRTLLADELVAEPSTYRRPDADPYRARACERCGRSIRDLWEHSPAGIGAVYEPDGRRAALCGPCAFPRSRASDTLVRPELKDPEAEVQAVAFLYPPKGPLDVNFAAEAIRACLLMWDRVAPGEFCSWRPLLEGLDRIGLVDPVAINWACEHVGVERRRAGGGERWRLKK